MELWKLFNLNMNFDSGNRSGPEKPPPHKNTIFQTAFDCPANVPNREFAYDDHFARYTAFPLIGAAYSPQPQLCFE